MLRVRRNRILCVELSLSLLSAGNTDDDEADPQFLRDRLLRLSCKVRLSPVPRPTEETAAPPHAERRGGIIGEVTWGTSAAVSLAH